MTGHANGIHDVEALLRRHEGWRVRPYRDTTGHLTIGHGRNLDAKGITREEAGYLLANDLKAARTTAERYSWFSRLDRVRQAVILDMLINLGPRGFKSFKKTRRKVQIGHYGDAAEEMLDSTWARQVGRKKDQRAGRLAEMMRTGEWPTR